MNRLISIALLGSLLLAGSAWAGPQAAPQPGSSVTVNDTPTNGETTVAASSNSVYDHINGTLHAWVVGATSALTLNTPIVLDEATGDEVAMMLNYTTNKATSGHDTGLVVNQTDTASPGTSSLADFQVGGSSKWRVTNTGAVYGSGAVQASGFNGNSGISATSLVTLPIQNSHSFTAADNVVEMGSGTHSNSSGVLSVLAILPTYNQTGTAAATDLLINRTETAVGTGEQNLIDAQVGGTSKFKVRNGGLVINAVQAVTCADSGGAGAQTATITPTSSYIEITNADADGCDITMGETGMAAGAKVDICVVSNAGTTVNFADTAGVSELAGAFAADVDDCITLRYGNTTTWREVTRSAN